MELRNLCWPHTHTIIIGQIMTIMGVFMIKDCRKRNNCPNDPAVLGLTDIILLSETALTNQFFINVMGIQHWFYAMMLVSWVFCQLWKWKKLGWRFRLRPVVPVSGGMSVSVTISPASTVGSEVICSLSGNIGAAWHGVMPSVDVRVLLGISSACSMSSCFMISSASIAWPGESEPGVAARGITETRTAVSSLS